MTRIAVTRRGRRWAFTAEGHATGSPEACAGVSALLCALGLWLESKPRGVRRGSFETAPGYARVRFTGGGAAAECVAAGLRAIAEQYPAAVEVRFERRPSRRGKRP